MKLEKREISLNESDSIADAIGMEKLLLMQYGCALEKITRKETRIALLENIKRIGEDLFLLCDLKAVSTGRNEK